MDGIRREGSPAGSGRDDEDMSGGSKGLIPIDCLRKPGEDLPGFIAKRLSSYSNEAKNSSNGFQKNLRTFFPRFSFRKFDRLVWKALGMVKLPLVLPVKYGIVLMS
jgi:hypothetical protein